MFFQDHSSRDLISVFEVPPFYLFGPKAERTRRRCLHLKNFNRLLQSRFEICFSQPWSNPCGFIPIWPVVWLAHMFKGTQAEGFFSKHRVLRPSLESIRLQSWYIQSCFQHIGSENLQQSARTLLKCTEGGCAANTRGNNLPARHWVWNNLWPSSFSTFVLRLYHVVNNEEKCLQPRYLYRHNFDMDCVWALKPRSGKTRLLGFN